MMHASTFFNKADGTLLIISIVVTVISIVTHIVTGSEKAAFGIEAGLTGFLTAISLFALEAIVSIWAS